MRIIHQSQRPLFPFIRKHCFHKDFPTCQLQLPPPQSLNIQVQHNSSKFRGAAHVASACFREFCRLRSRGLTGNHASSSHPTNCELLEMVRGETDNYTDTSWIVRQSTCNVRKKEEHLSVYLNQGLPLLVSLGFIFSHQCTLIYIDMNNQITCVVPCKHLVTTKLSSIRITVVSVHIR